jgi:NitT/TauT family transport system substrate-binding protein
MNLKVTIGAAIASSVLALSAALPASAADLVKIVIGGGAPFWDTNIPEVAKQKGFLDEAGIEIERLEARGGGDILRVLLAAEADLVGGVGQLSVFSAYEAGAPLKIVGNQMNTPYDVVWYVKKDSPIQGLDDMPGHTIGYSSPGSSTNMVIIALQEELKSRGLGEMKPVATGGFGDTYTQVISGQVDAGFTSVPFMHDKALAGDIRYVFPASDAKGFQGVSMRVYVASIPFLEQRRDVAVRTLRAFQKAIDWSYANPEEAKAILAKSLNVDIATIPDMEKRIPKEALDLANVGGIETSYKVAMANDFIKAQLTPEDFEKLVDLSVVTEAVADLK